MKHLKLLYSVFFALLLVTITSCDDEETTTDCPTAQARKVEAQVAYGLDSSNEDLCNALKTAIQNEIAVCGDVDGSLQSQLVILGDCTTSNAGTLSVRAGTLTLDFPTNSANLNSGTITVEGSNFLQGANRTISFEVSENATGVDIIQNFVLTINGGSYFPNMDGFDDFTSNITVNSNGTIQGTFGGIVTRTDGADLSLTQGTIDLAY